MKLYPLGLLSSVTIVSSVGLLSAGPAHAAVPLTLDISDGYTFSGVQRNIFYIDDVQLPLGPDFALVPTRVELLLADSAPGQVRAVFPGQGGQTILIDSGDPILFEMLFENMTFQVRLTALSTPGFGGGLGNTIEFETTADLQGSGEGVANISLPNLGFLEQTNSLSVLLGNLGGVFAQHDLGVDLNGDGANNAISINNGIYAGSVFTGDAPGFDTDLDPINSFVYRLQRRGLERLQTLININPSVGLSLDIVEWTMSQEIVISAIPEPAGLVLAWVAAAISLTHRRNCGGRPRLH